MDSVPGVVVVVGSLNRDILLDVAALPRAGETVTATGSSAAWGGKGANQAVAAARLGTTTYLIGAVGRDHYGEEALADLHRYGVDTTHVVRTDEPTGTAHVLRDRRGENLIVVVPAANHALTWDDVTTAIRGIDAEEAVVVAGCEISDGAVLAAATASAQRGWRFVLNPAPARPLPDDLLAKIDVLTPNATEVAGLGRPSVAALQKAGVSAVIVTRGEDGVEVHEGGDVRRIPACPAEVVDTVGAGDAFTAGLAVGLAAGASLDEAARLGAAAGAIAVTGPGARGAELTLAAVEALVRHRKPSGRAGKDAPASP